jgi:hypothetical protein
MIVDKALANCKFHWSLQGGDTGKRKVEHRSFFQLWFTHNNRIRLDTTGARLIIKRENNYQQKSW